MLDIADLEPAGNDALVVERVDAAQLEEAGLAAPLMASFTCSLMSSINWRTVASSIGALMT